MTENGDTAIPALLSSLHGECFKEPWSSSAFEDLLETPGVRPVVISDEDVPVGMGLLRVVSDEAEILTLGVVPTARRTGLGKALVETLESLATEQGALALFLEVSSTNKAALALYQSCGFDPAGQRKAYYADGSDALILRKQL